MHVNLADRHFASELAGELLHNGSERRQGGGLLFEEPTSTGC